MERRAGVASVGRTIVWGARAAATVTVVPPELNTTEACVSQPAGAAGAKSSRDAGVLARRAAERRLRRVHGFLGLVRGGVRAGG